jgi:hypothetical protein
MFHIYYYYYNLINNSERKKGDMKKKGKIKILKNQIPNCKLIINKTSFKNQAQHIKEL